MKSTFSSKSDWRLPKFHLTTHYGKYIRLFGSLHAIDSGHGERQQKLIKEMYKNTTRHFVTAIVELADRLALLDAVQYMVDVFGIRTMASDRRLNKQVESVANVRAFHEVIGRPLELRSGDEVEGSSSAGSLLSACQFPGGLDDYRAFFREMFYITKPSENATVAEQAVAFWTRFKHVRLYRELHMSHGLVRRGKCLKIIVRAQPRSFGGRPWYDFVAVDGEEGTFAARSLCFVELEEAEDSVPANAVGGGGAAAAPAKNLSSLYVFARYHVAASSVMKTLKLRGKGDLSKVHPVLPLPLIEADPSLEKGYGFFETISIDSPLWVEKSVRKAGLFWVLTNMSKDLEVKVSYISSVPPPHGAVAGAGVGAGTGAGAGARSFTTFNLSASSSSSGAPACASRPAPFPIVSVPVVHRPIGNAVVQKNYKRKR